ncbi:low-complexity tail membrane protein [Pseudanabaena sp. FACHB-1998]|uniref:low-complexity tail membrane protein n=1 Tax=Pseudanabaena sp. FACHB-1998 TaxID=2692858 RepID=UPI001681C0E6|nr:low-complexity tail membrane protein [Pseudanabaena sp. FACHB-1998]MBD2176104.1 low-complexity tail membrane protein [Pseudanabaena sp. FACHB-1998]
MKSPNSQSLSGFALSDSNFVSNHPFIWGNIALTAGVPWLLAWSMAGLAVGDPVFPTWLEILLLGFPAIALGAWLQWQQPFSPFSLWFIAKSSADLSENERRVLTLIKQQRNGWHVTGWLAIAIALVMSAIFCKIYIAAPLAQAIAPFPAGLRLFGILWAEVCFLLSNILLQSGVSALRIKLTAASELSNLQPFPVEKIKNSFTTIGWRSPQLLKFFEDEPEAAIVVIDRQKEINDTLLAETPDESESENIVEEIQNDLEISDPEESENVVEEIQSNLEIVDESIDSLEQPIESLIEIPDSQDSQVLENPQEIEAENNDEISELELPSPDLEVKDVDLTSESQVSGHEPEVEVVDLISESQASTGIIEENLNENSIIIDSSDEAVETSNNQPEEFISESIADVFEPESEEQITSSELQDVQVEVEEFVEEPEAIAQPPEDINLEVEVDITLELEAELQVELDIQEVISDSHDDEAFLETDLENSLDVPQTESPSDSLEIDLADINENPELGLVNEKIIAEEDISGFISDTAEQLEDGVLLSSELTESPEVSESFSVTEELSNDLPEQPDAVAPENVLVVDNDLVDQVVESSDSYEQELSEAVVDATSKVDSKAIHFLKKARKKGFAQKNYGFGKPVKPASANTTNPEATEPEKAEVDSFAEESQVEEIISETSIETADIISDVFDAGEESKSDADEDVALTQESIDEPTEEEYSPDFDEELDELVTFNFYVENILRQYLEEPSEEITEMAQNEQVEDQKLEDQEVEDIMEISAISEQATEIAEEILIAELIQEEESSNQEVEEIVEIAAISEQATEIAEEVLISEDNLENSIPQSMEVPMETQVNVLNTEPNTEPNIEAIASEEGAKYLVQESLVDQFLAKIEELNIADKANKATGEKDAKSRVSDEIDEFADLEALLNNNPSTEGSKE